MGAAERIGRATGARRKGGKDGKLWRTRKGQGDGEDAAEGLCDGKEVRMEGRLGTGKRRRRMGKTG
jgi:hypothetical protein